LGGMNSKEIVGRAPASASRTVRVTIASVVSALCPARTTT
jgi:hypothetical protein